MALSAYLKIDEIDGESTQADHADEIDIHDLRWKIERQATKTGRGRSRAVAEAGALYLKKYTDAASPYLILACMQGKFFANVELSVQTQADGGSVDYLNITMQNVVIVKLDTLGVGEDGERQLIEEELGLTFQKVKYKYTVYNADHSVGDEHEINFVTNTAV